MMNTSELKKIVGSLLVLGFDGPQITDSLKNFLEQWDLGGVILFKRNIHSLEQLLQLNEGIYRVSELTPILSVDQEGGRVFRLPEPFTSFPPMAGVGEKCETEGNEIIAMEVGKVFGRELRAAGFNLDYAPVLDVNSNPQNPIIGDRAFSDDPEQVAKAALAFLAGLQAEGVMGCGKHFPGHGDTAQDSHLTLPTVEKSKTELERCELIPFQLAIKQKIPLLMTAHVLYPELDKDWPATLSEKILTDLLRKKMGFEGLVISDDLFMQGIAGQRGLEEAAERFLRAGGDLVLLCHQESAQRRVAAHLVHRAEQDGRFRNLLEKKADKMGKFRKSLAKGIQGDLLVIGCESHQKVSEAIT